MQTIAKHKGKMYYKQYIHYCIQ